MQQVRELSLQLRPSMLDDLGLLATLRWYVERYTATTGVRVVLEHAPVEQPLPPDVATAAYRIIQEALTNVARHAAVDKVTVLCSVDDQALHIRIEDQGKGFHSEQAPTSRGFGLTSMRERATHVGGDLRVDSAPGMGTRLTARLPFGTGVPQERRYDDDSAGR